MKKEHLILTGLAALAGFGIGKLVKKNSEKKEIKESTSQKQGEPQLLSRGEIIERLKKYSFQASSYESSYLSAYLSHKPRPVDFPEEYYFFCIDTFGWDISIDLLFGTHKNGIITQEELLRFSNSSSVVEYPKFTIRNTRDSLSDDVSSEEITNMASGEYRFGYCIWEGEKSYEGWYRSIENLEENVHSGCRIGGPVEVRALVSKTVYEKVKELQKDLYDIPAKEFLDQLDKIFEEEISRSRTKQEIGG